MSDVAKPSQVWNQWLADLEFLSEMRAESLRLHVGFGYYLGSPIEGDLWAASRWRVDKTDYVATRKIEDFSRLTQAVSQSFWVSEPDPARERFSVAPISNVDIWINTDTLRTQVDVTNLTRLGLLGHEPLSYVEVGGGTGNLP